MTEVIYKKDLSKTDKNGTFFCEGCGTEINPDVEDNTVYEISTRMKDDKIESIIVDCKKCGSKTELDGFLKYPQ